LISDARSIETPDSTIRLAGRRHESFFKTLGSFSGARNTQHRLPRKHGEPRQE
jgi:hypothetical protein